MLKRVWLIGVLALVAACEAPLECSVGEVRYQGRPPRTMFAFDRTCREDCFSLPATEAGAARCDPTCPDVLIGSPDGALFDDRILTFADIDSLSGAGTTETLALIYTFGFVDDAGGTAPDTWGMTAVGPRTYLSGQVDGTARFIMDVGVSAVERLPDEDLLLIRDTVSQAMSADPGRLEILKASPTRIAGRFFLAYDTPTKQPQGEVMGCFDLGLSDVQSSGGSSYQVIRK
jgi:hypothetical protein